MNDIKLTLPELQVLLQRHPEIRVSSIPLDTGLLLENQYLLKADEEGWVCAYDVRAIQEYCNDLVPYLR